MRDLDGRTALITGAARGIGFALARRAAAAGMRLALGDLDAAGLERAADTLRAAGAEVVTRAGDVRDPQTHVELDAAAREAFGAVHLLVENAGIGAAGSILRGDFAEWKASIDVNLYGVLHGLRASVPGMIASGQPGHVLTVASLAGVAVNPGMGPYTAAKHGVVTLTETLRIELKQGGHGDRIGVSVFCPGWIKTDIAFASRARASAEGTRRSADPVRDATARFVEAAVAGGIDPADAAEAIFGAIGERRFYIFTHGETRAIVRKRADRMLAATPDPETALA